ncbi:bacteriohemerythrin [Sunxiuqinia indica]|uniref:bacteriohemerythrin n=1 Tax=Sunxiuqinia indica TaxID=2692584 RepID=UPI001359A3A0|nr:hemerythrin family protein [Sunxiuqinia indica]
MATVNTIHWKDKYSIGNDSIDSDHIKLFEIYNQLAELINTGYNKSTFTEALSKMTDYSIYHFKKEEAYMEKMMYPDLTEHKKEHRAYILEISYFNANFATNLPPNVEDVMQFLEKWWKNHIQKLDYEYEYFRKANHLKVRYQTLKF